SLSLSLSLSLCRVSLAASAQAQAEERRSLAGNSPVPASPATANTPPNTTAAKIDDRLRVAKERREEADRQQAAKDSQILERERKAKLQVERQMEERQKKLDEQRRKEEQRRSAVEEKRKQKQEEEKEHYEAVMRRTLERSQRVEQRQKRWSWGGLSESDNRSGKESSSIPFHSALYHMDRTAKFDKRSTSTMNLKQLSEAGINKRLSSSSATLINSPDKSKSPFHPPLGPPPLSLIGCNPPLLSVGPSLKKRSSSLTRAGGGKTQTPSKLDKGTTDDQARKPLASPVDGGFLSRLLTPTQASLARSKSAAALSAEGGDAPGTPPTLLLASIISLATKEKRFSSPGGKRPASPSNIAGRHRSPSPAPPPSDSAKPPSPQPTSAKPPPIQRPALTPTGPPTLRKRDSKPKDLCPIQPVVHQSPEAPQTSTTPTPTHTTSNKSMAGTNSAAEAAMILAENRRLAREKKEREEALRVLREEEEKLRKEEDKRLAEEDRLKRLEEEKRLAEERKKKEEEDALMAEADRERLEEEEAVRQAELQKEREEAEAQAAIEAEKVRIERERVMAQNQQERMERKKVGGESPFQLVHFIIHTDYFGFKCLFHLLTRRLPYTDWLSPSPSSPVPKGRLVEGSEFLNEDSNKLAPGLNGKPGPWSFEELIDLGGRNQGLIDCDGGPEGPRVAFEDKGIPVATLHPSSQPIEALSEM
uniref:MAP7 domain containing 3 n=1 Tax=Oncorhynchus kisutch TaxID=8019 RepID=A0A8C7DR25_ONCKI